MKFSPANRVVAVIPTHNRKDDLAVCMEALSRQTFPIATIIILDNASTDGTEQMIKTSFPNALYRKNSTNNGAAGGFCDAISWAMKLGHEWIWITDNDSVPDRRSLELLIGTASAEPNIVALIPKKLTPSGDLWCGEVILKSPDQPHDAPVELYNQQTPFDCDWAPNTGMLLHREAVLKTGLPRVDIFAWGEDTEYCLRLRRAGRIVVVPSSVVTHRNPSLGWPVPYPFLWKMYYVHRNEVFLRLRGLKPPKRSLLQTIRHTLAAAGAILLKQDHRAARLRVFLTATIHGIIGRLGKAPRWVHG